jgi:uncharacterized protein YoaH (UPF0181 family)
VTADLPVESINALHEAGMSSGASVALVATKEANNKEVANKLIL